MTTASFVDEFYGVRYIFAHTLKMSFSILCTFTFIVLLPWGGGAYFFQFDLFHFWHCTRNKLLQKFYTKLKLFTKIFSVHGILAALYFKITRSHLINLVPVLILQSNMADRPESHHSSSTHASSAATQSPPSHLQWSAYSGPVLFTGIPQIYWQIKSSEEGSVTGFSVLWSSYFAFLCLTYLICYCIGTSLYANPLDLCNVDNSSNWCKILHISIACHFEYFSLWLENSF